MERWILSIDTSADVPSCAAWDQGERFIEVIGAAAGHDENLAAMLRDACDRAQIEIADLSALAIARGPGSFTGLRIGYSYVKALVQTLQIALLEFCPFAADAAEKTGAVFVVSDARRDEVFVLERGQGSTEGSEVTIRSVRDVIESARRADAGVFIRSDSPALEAQFRDAGVRILQAGMTTARSGLGIVAAQAVAGARPLSTLELARCEPVYLRKVAARTLAERAGAA